MPLRPEMDDVARIYGENAELESEIAQIEERIEQNHRKMVEAFFPYLLSVYAAARPRIGETAIVVDFERSHCFELTIRSVDGYRVKAQEGDKPVYHHFDLNPSLLEYEVAVIVIP